MAEAKVMSEPEGHPTLEEVLDTYLAAVEEPDVNSAREWGRRFPEHARALRDFAVTWKLAAILPVDPHTTPLDAAAFGERGRAVAEEALRRAQEMDEAETAEPPIETLAAAAKARGLAPSELAARLSLSVPLFAKLNRRLIEPTSIPRELIEDLAAALGQAPGTIARYLAQPSTLAQGAFHRAEGKPGIVAREDFTSAVRADPALSDDQRARWLLLASPGTPSP